MGVLIDASVLIEAERGRLDLATHLQRRPNDEAFLSVVTASELLHGVHRARDQAIKARRTAWVEGVLAAFPLLPIDLGTARIHSRISAEVMSQGTPVGPHDLWLAATCLVHGLDMVTANVREFERVSGLTVDPWLPNQP